MEIVDQPKKNNKLYDFVIVGQGLAGSILALTLIKSGFTVFVIDNPSRSNCSKVAAGIWNPIVFKRLTKSWLADVLVPKLISFYEYWEKEFQTTLIHHRNILKPFTEEQEKELWIKKANSIVEPNVFLDKNTYTNLQISSTQTVSTYSKVLHAGNLDVVCFLESTKNYLIDKDCYLQTPFNYSNLLVTESEINYEGITSKQLIFCEGHLISKNPYFDWIPMKPAKGETLIISCEDLQLNNNIYNKGFFIMPLGNNEFKVGATYEWNELNDIPTELGKADLLKKIITTIKTPFTIISHQAGVRPSVIDRRPVIGKHPNYKNLHLFNGLGTKGVMIAPYFAKQFANHFTSNSSIDSEVNLNRFKLPN